MRKTALIWAVWITLAIVGCKSLNQVSYKATGVAVVGADFAMTEWGHYVKQFHPGVEKETKVKAAYEHYQQAVVLVSTTAEAYLRNKESVPARSDFEAAIAASSTALAELVNVIRSFGVKI